MKNQKQETKQKKQEKQEQKEPSGHFQAWLKKEKNIITKFVLIPNSLAKIYKNIYNFSILDIFYKWYGFSLTHTFPFKDIIFDPGKYGSEKTCILTYLTKCFRYTYKKTNLTLHCVKCQNMGSLLTVFSRIRAESFILVVCGNILYAVMTFSSKITNFERISGISFGPENFGIFDSVLIRENKGQTKTVFWHILRSEDSIMFIIAYRGSFFIYPIILACSMHSLSLYLFLSDKIFSFERIKDSVLLRENTGQRKPAFWHIIRSVALYYFLVPWFFKYKIRMNGMTNFVRIFQFILMLP